MRIVSVKRSGAHAYRLPACSLSRPSSRPPSLLPSLSAQVILDADIYEEEDAHPNSLGLYLGENLLLEDAVFLLEKVGREGGGGREGGKVERIVRAAACP